MEFKKYRPESIIINEDKKSVSLINELFEVITDFSVFFKHAALCFESERTTIISHLLFEFLEDIHFDIGIWNAYEKYNRVTFGNPFPCTMPDNNYVSPADKFNSYRIQHFLWNIYQLIDDRLVLPPQNEDLLMLSIEISKFFAKSIKRFPKISTVQQYLQTANDADFEVKRKLIWLGTKSYLFRENYKLYNQKKGGKEEIAITDDFVNQHNTTWSGLGVIDILPEIIKISKSKKNDIKSWYERHFSYYLIKSVIGYKLVAENIVTKQNYRIIYYGKFDAFKIGDLVFGGTVKLGDQWYWSGVQQTYNYVPEDKIQETRKAFIKESAKIVYRYDKERLKTAIERNSIYYHDFISYYGSDFIEFPTGLDYAASIQKKDSLNYQKLSEEEFEKLKIKHNLINRSPHFNLPDDIINNENGIALFFNLEVGQQLIRDYNFIKSALVKKGDNLTQDDYDVIFSFVEDQSISPDFVYKILAQFGSESVLKTYHLQKESELNYLLHKYKGVFFRNIYPSFTVFDE